MNDELWFEGYGAGLANREWVQVVAGRLLTASERKELADGWRCGIRDIARYRADLEMMADVPGTSNETIPY